MQALQHINAFTHAYPVVAQSGQAHVFHIYPVNVIYSYYSAFLQLFANLQGILRAFGYLQGIFSQLADYVLAG